MWTKEDENEWKKLTDLREANILEVRKLHTIEMLEDMINCLREGKNLPADIRVEYIRESLLFAHDGLAPAVSKRIILMYRLKGGEII